MCFCTPGAAWLGGGSGPGVYAHTFPFPFPSWFGRYYYYGGLVYLGLQDFAAAESFFSLALVVPCEATSAIMAAAYAHSLLAGLLASGAPCSQPSFAGPAIRSLSGQMQPYADFVAAVKNCDVGTAGVVAAKHEGLWAKDHTTGLVQQCLAQIPARRMLKLRGTYATLPLRMLADRCGLSSAQDAEALLCRLVATGQLHASVDQESGTASFHQDVAAHDDEGAALDLLARIHSIAEVWWGSNGRSGGMALTFLVYLGVDASHSGRPRAGNPPEPPLLPQQGDCRARGCWLWPVPHPRCRVIPAGSAERGRGHGDGHRDVARRVVIFLFASFPPSFFRTRLIIYFKAAQQRA